MSRNEAGATRAFSLVVDGQPITGLRAGEGAERGLIIALHGGGYDARYWHADPALSLLESGARLGFDVVAIDRPGYRGSVTGSPEGVNMTRQVDSVFALIAALDPSGQIPVSLIGHSMGGILALMIAADARASRLLAVDVSGVPLRYPPKMQEIVEQSTELAKSSPTTGEAGRDPAMLRWMFYGHEGSYDPRVTVGIDAQNAVPSAEMADAFNAPSNLPPLMRQIRIPLQWTIADQEKSSLGGESILAEIRELMAECPYLRTSLQRASGHNISAHHVGFAYHLRALAFFDECRALRGQTVA